MVHIDEDPWQLGKNYPLEVGLIGDTKTGLSELDRRRRPKNDAGAGRRRSTAASALRRAARNPREEAWKQCEAARSQRPMSPLTFMESIARILPARCRSDRRSRHYHRHAIGAARRVEKHFRLLRPPRLGSSGWGLGVAIGVKLAWPQCPVLAILGEGAALYGIQGLWSAAHHRVPVTFLIANNAQYQILKSAPPV